MSVKKTTYIIEFKTKEGIAQINMVTSNIDEATEAAQRLNGTLKSTGNDAGQAASKMGLAGAAVTELGRTVSDANYGMTAMANNLQQLSTLFITLSATSGGFMNGIALMRKALFEGPLGLIVLFQVAFAVMEKFAMNQKKSGEASKELKNNYDALAVSVGNLTEAERERLEVSEKLTNEQAAQIMLQESALNVESVLADIKIKSLERERELLRLLGSDTSALDAEIARLTGQRAGLEERIAGLLDLLRNGPDSEKRDKEKKVKLYKEKDVSGLFADLFGLEESNAQSLINSADNALADLTNTEGYWEGVRNKQAFENAEARKTIAKNEMETRLAMLDMIGNAAMDFGYVIGEQTAAGKLIASAGALISTYAAVAKTLQIYGGTPLGWASAAAVTASGLAQVAQINRVRVPKGRSGGSSGSSSQGQSASGGINPSFNIVGTSNASQLREAVEGQLDRPVQAYVTTKQVRSGEELDRNIRGGASFG